MISIRQTTALLCFILLTRAAFADSSKTALPIGTTPSRHSTKKSGDPSRKDTWSALIQEVRMKGQPWLGTAPECEKLAESLSTPRLVGIGESTHGTKEVVEFKARLILAMAKRGRNVVFLEENLVATEPVNEWLLGKRPEVSILELLQAFMPIYQTQEFAAFLTQAREYNASVKDDAQKMRLYGVDVQAYGGPWNPIPTLRSIFKAQGVEAEADLSAASAFLENGESPSLEAIAKNRSIVERLRVIASKLNPTPEGSAQAMCYANALVRSNETSRIFSVGNPFYEASTAAHGTTPTMSNNNRDAGMAENLRILMDAKCPNGGKATLWAHNGHIGKTPYLPSARNLESTFSNIGSLLSAWLRENYVTLGVLTGAGTFRGMAVLPGGKFWFFA